MTINVWGCVSYHRWSRQTVARVSRPIADGLTELLSSVIRYNKVVEAVERGNVDAVCSKLARIKTFVCPSFVFLGFDAHVAESDVVKVIRSALGGSVRLVLLTSQLVSRSLKLDPDVPFTSFGVSSRGSYKVTAYDGDLPVSTLIRAAGVCASVDDDSVAKEAVDAVVIADVAQHSDWVDRVVNAVEAPGDSMYVLVHATDALLVKSVLSHRLTAKGRRVTTCPALESHSDSKVKIDREVAQAQLEVGASTATSVVVLVLDAHLVTPRRRAELIKYAHDSGAYCVVCTAVIDPVNFCYNAEQPLYIANADVSGELSAASGVCGGVPQWQPVVVATPSAYCRQVCTPSEVASKPASSVRFWVGFRCLHLLFGRAVTMSKYVTFFSNLTTGVEYLAQEILDQSEGVVSGVHVAAAVSAVVKFLSAATAGSGVALGSSFAVSGAAAGTVGGAAGAGVGAGGRADGGVTAPAASAVSESGVIAPSGGVNCVSVASSTVVKEQLSAGVTSDAFVTAVTKWLLWKLATVTETPPVGDDRDTLLPFDRFVAIVSACAVLSQRQRRSAGVFCGAEVASAVCGPQLRCSS